MSEITLTINGRAVKASSEDSLLKAATSAGIYIPALCYYPGLAPLAEEVPDRACQLCLVEVGGEIVQACHTPAVDGMTVQTESSKVKELRRKHITAILRRHPNACLTCDRRDRCGPTDICLRHVAVEDRCVICPRNQNCELQKATDHIGVEVLPPFVPKKLPLRKDSPFFVRDHNLCILCERCVRVCEQIRGAKAIDFAYPCHDACPSGIDIPRYLRLIARGRPEAALAVVRERVPFPGSLGRVCIHPCEQACQRGLEIDEPLCIRMLKRYADDNSNGGWKSRGKKLPPTGKSVAVVGAGPAGLTAAMYLAKLGHKVTVFELLPVAGGMMHVGIPEYRLPRNILADEIDYIKSVGVDIRLSTHVESLDELFAQGNEAIVLAVGAHQGMKLGVEGEDLPGVIESADFLRRANLGEKVDVGTRVGVVGGGNVAIDAARIPLRLGAKKVTIFYRRTRAEMPASPEEIDAALEEGIEIVYLVAPTGVSREKGVLKLECQRMELGESDASGRRRPVPIEGSEFMTELDTLIAAIGQRPEVPKAFGVEVARGNTINVDANMMTSRQGVFSAGDCETGPVSVVQAIAGGRKAAEAIDRYLGGKGDISEALVDPAEATCWLSVEELKEKAATFKHMSPEESIKSFNEVEYGFDRETAMAEALRCLQCHVIKPPEDRLLPDTDCQFCGACVDACPVGALTELSNRWVGKPDRELSTVCPYCGVGCQLDLHVKNGRVVNVKPRLEGPANNGQACVKGKFGLTEVVHHPERLKAPLVRRNGDFVEVTWIEALEFVADNLKKYGANDVATIASAKCTNEDNYVLQKLARAVLGTNNVDHCARLCDAPNLVGLTASFGSGAMTNTIREIGDASCIVSMGSNTTAAHPVVWLEINRALSKGARLIVINPRQIDLCQRADLWLQQNPGTDVALLMGMMRVIVDEGLVDQEFVKERCENYEAFLESLKNFDLDSVETITGVVKADIAEAARTYATQKPSTFLYCSMTQNSHGTNNVFAAANLAMLTGNIGKPSTGVNPLRGQNNVQGACDMGGLPDVYPGYQAVGEPSVQRKFEEAWNAKLNSNPGMTLSEIMPAALEGKIKAMYLVGENPVLSDPDAKHVKEALEKLEFFVVQDIFLTETAELADVVLPAACFAEKDGTFTNTERRVQRVRKAVEPPGEAKPDWWIVSEVAKRMGGKGFEYAGPEQIMEEIAGLTPIYGGIGYERLEQETVQWPCPTKEHAGTPYLHAGSFVRGKGKFVPLEFKSPAETPDDQYPLLLTTERSPFHYHTSTMTGRVKGLKKLRSEEYVEINPVDAEKLGIENDGWVKVVSRRGEVKARAKSSMATPVGVVTMTFHFAECPTNMLTNTALDPVAKIPELKITAVRVEKLASGE